MSPSSGYIVQRDALEELFVSLHRRGYTVIGPTVRDAAIVYDGDRRLR